MKLDMDKFKIGDEVQFIERPTTKFVLTCVDKDGKLAGIGYDGVAFVDKNPDKWKKTGRYFKEAVSLMNAIADRR